MCSGKVVVVVAETKGKVVVVVVVVVVAGERVAVEMANADDEC